jgi:hypothetical protein
MLNPPLVGDSGRSTTRLEIVSKTDIFQLYRAKLLYTTTVQATTYSSLGYSTYNRRGVPPETLAASRETDAGGGRRRRPPRAPLGRSRT